LFFDPEALPAAEKLSRGALPSEVLHCHVAADLAVVSAPRLTEEV
jgi:hypothetical protein